MIQDIEKFRKAVVTIKSSATFVLDYGNDDTAMTETLFNKVRWVTGESSDGTAIETTTNPHSEITWTKVKAEMDKL